MHMSLEVKQYLVKAKLERRAWLGLGLTRAMRSGLCLWSTATIDMNEARSSHLPFWGPSEGFFPINSTAVG